MKNRAALANLRRGLGKKPGTTMEMFPYINDKIPPTKKESAYFLVASLFGFYPDAEEIKGNLGISLSILETKTQVQRNDSSEDKKQSSVERRFVALLNAKEEDLPNHLRQIIGLLKSKEIPINWYQLLSDVKFWSSEGNYNTQRQWAKSFWQKQN
jgi:CRISPR system Cascade subunit CasB